MGKLDKQLDELIGLISKDMMREIEVLKAAEAKAAEAKAAEAVPNDTNKKDPSIKSEKHKLASNVTVACIEINTQLLFMLVDKCEEEGKTIDKWVTEAICEKLF